MKKLFLRIQYLLWAFKRRKRIHLFDTVIHKGEKWSVINGPAAPIWKIMKYTELDSNKIKRESEMVHERDFELVTGFERTLRVIKQDYDFQMTNWYSIDLRKPLFDRISFIDSSNIKFS